jgi:cyclopropane fatty-acyl-phospholipid synthase-like methyltransferase
MASIISYFAERHKRSRQRRYWEKLWKSPEKKPVWFDLESPRSPIIEAATSGWIRSGARVLEIGCGRGLSADWLATHGFDVTAIDFSRHAIDDARAKYGSQRKNLRFEVVDITVPTELGTFDVMIDSGCFHCIPVELHSYYGGNVIQWSQLGTRLLIMAHTEGISPEERQRQLETVLVPPFELLSAGHGAHPARPQSSRWTFQLVRSR